jgi:chromosome partition protein MukF
LRVTIAELVAGIERRQRGLDLRQEEFQSEIRRLLEADWFGALAQCQSLLESTSGTLRELNELLLRDTASLLALLHDIEQLAHDSGAHEAAAAALQLVEQIDRIAAWGGARQHAWSEYFQYVHRYLREVVRLDPTRALTQRLRDQLAGVGQRFALSLAGASPMRILRTAAPAIERPAVTRPRAAREREPVLESGEDAQVVLEARVRTALESGATSLADVTDRVNGAVEPSERFAMTGRVAQATAALSRVHSQPERPWVRVGSAIEIEDWQLAHENEDSETAAGE